MHEMMTEESLHEKVKPLCELREKLTDCTAHEMAKGVGCVDTDEAGKVVDMIKDLAEAEEKIIKACYYKTVIAAMEEYEEEEPRYGDTRSGYNHRRYSNGEYAPAGRGHRSGYPMIPHIDQDLSEMQQYWDRDRPGYSRSQSGTRMSERTGSGSMDVAKPSRYGYSYDQYEESKKMSDKDSMDKHAKEHLSDSIVSIKEIWASADPALKKKMKADLTALVGEMTV